jgi:c-di-GMP-binding flagellar brake protein YcgR
MASGSERRTKRRIVVGPEVTIRFQVKDFSFGSVRITNLSSCGCFATIGRADERIFQQGTLLEKFHFEHPDLAGDPILGKIAYVLGGGGGLDLVGLGIHFASITPEMEAKLERYVDVSLLT